MIAKHFQNVSTESLLLLTPDRLLSPRPYFLLIDMGISGTAAQSDAVGTKWDGHIVSALNIVFGMEGSFHTY